MKADNAVKLSRFKHLIKLLNAVQKHHSSHIEFTDKNEESECTIHGTDEVFLRIDNFIKIRNRLNLSAGIVGGFLLGLFSAYILIPSGATYFYSSEKGLIPPQYDALFKTKEPYEQIVQILTHETQGEKKRRGGPHRGNQMLFTSTINDTATIQLWYKLGKKSVITNISQKKGEQFIRTAVKDNMEKSGVDSAAKYYAGIEESNIADQVSDAVSRTSSMKIEQGFLTEPVIRIVINGKKVKQTFTNYLPWEGRFSSTFTINDSDPANIHAMDNTREDRKLRVPIPADEQLYVQLQDQFIEDYLNPEENKEGK